MEFNFEGFLRSRFARGVRWTLAGAVVYGVVGEWYVMNRCHAYDVSEARRWVVDYSPISKPKAQIYVLPDLLYPNYTPWTPVNGDVVLGRVLPQHPNWVQLIGGRYVERSSCGIDLLVPEEDYERVRAEREDELLPPIGAKALSDQASKNQSVRGEKSLFSKWKASNNN